MILARPDAYFFDDLDHDVARASKRRNAGFAMRVRASSPSRCRRWPMSTPPLARTCPRNSLHSSDARACIREPCTHGPRRRGPHRAGTRARGGSVHSPARPICVAGTRAHKALAGVDALLTPTVTARGGADRPLSRHRSGRGVEQGRPAPDAPRQPVRPLRRLAAGARPPARCRSGCSSSGAPAASATCSPSPARRSADRRRGADGAARRRRDWIATELRTFACRRRGKTTHRAVALAATLAIQLYVSFAATATAVLAPEIAQRVRHQARWIGVFVGIVYAGGMFGSLACGGFIERYGRYAYRRPACPVRGRHPRDRACTGALRARFLRSPPSSSGQATGRSRLRPPSCCKRPHRRHGARSRSRSSRLACRPARRCPAHCCRHSRSDRLARHFAAVALLGAIVVAGAQPVRAGLDADRHRRGRFTLAGIFAPLAYCGNRDALRSCARVVRLFGDPGVPDQLPGGAPHRGLRWRLVAAGLGLTAATVGGVAGASAGATSPIACFAATRARADRPPAGACGIAMARPRRPGRRRGDRRSPPLFGVTAIGWNGVQLSEVARLAPAGSAGKVTGATGFVTFAGVVSARPRSR